LMCLNGAHGVRLTDQTRFNMSPETLGIGFLDEKTTK